MRRTLLLAGLLLTGHVQAVENWQAVKDEAKGQTVWFNA